MKKAVQAFAKAFPRARQHEADERVLLVSNPDDLAAINLPGVKAVIWEREMPGDIAPLLKRNGARWNRPRDKVIARDEAMLNLLFRKVTHQNRFSSDVAWPWNTTAYPHTDGYQKRLVVVYTAEAGNGMQWYPGHIPEEKEKALSDALKISPDPGAIRRMFNCQTVPPGHVIVMKGKSGNPREEQMVHNGQSTKRVYRKAYMLGYY